MRVMALCLLGMVTALSVYDVYGEEEPILLYSRAPEFVAADVSSNILICQKGDTLYGRDMDSGEERWHYGLKDRQRAWADPIFSNNENIMLFDYIQTCDMLCKATGKIVCEVSDKGEGGMFRIFSIRGTNWMQTFRRGLEGEEDRIILHSPDGKEQFDVPTNTLINGFMPDGKTIFGMNAIVEEGKKTTRTEVCFWELGSTVITKSFPMSQEVQGLVGLISSDNRMLFRRHHEGGNISEFVVADIHGGNIQRIIPLPGEVGTTYNRQTPDGFTYYSLTPDGAEIVLLSRDKQTVWLLNSTDGILLATLNMPDHTFLWGTISYDSAGNPYMVSKDGQGSAWLWAVTPNASPRKIFDGSQNFTGTIAYFKPPYFLTTERYDNPPDENIPYMLLSIFRMDDGQVRTVDAWPVVGSNFYMQRDRSWPVAGQSFNNWDCSDDMQRFIGVRGRFLTKHAKPEDRKLISDNHVVYERGKTEPIIEFRDYRLTAISPDGSHITVRDKRNDKKIIHVDSGKEVGVFSGQKVFSPNGNRIAAGLTVVNLADGYHQVVMYIPDSMKNSVVIPVQFSADGSRLLSRSKGRVLLHDADTGELLATFVESKRLVSRDVHISGPLGFVNGILGDAVNLASNFTDSAKEAPWLDCAFAANDTQVLTIAMDQLIRVWDARSGKLLRTIEISGEESDYPKYNRVILSPNGAYAYITRDRRFWDIAAGRMIGQYRSSGISIDNSAFSNDGEDLYFWNDDAVYYLPIHANQTQNN
jgi:WD40 repeat protein